MIRRVFLAGAGVDVLLVVLVFAPWQLVVVAAVVGAYLAGWWHRGRFESF